MKGMDEGMDYSTPITVKCRIGTDELLLEQSGGTKQFNVGTPHKNILVLQYIGKYCNILVLQYILSNQDIAIYIGNVRNIAIWCLNIGNVANFTYKCI